MIACMAEQVLHVVQQAAPGGGAFETEQQELQAIPESSETFSQVSNSDR